MKKSALTIEEQKQSLPILILDRIGIIGELLCEEIAKYSQVVFVSLKEPQILTESRASVIHIPYSKKFPIIPDEKYSHLIVVDDKSDTTKELLPKFLEKSDKDNAEFIFLAKKSEGKSNNFLKILDSYKIGKIIIYGDLFGQKVSFSSHLTSFINDFFYQVKTTGKIKIPGDGLLKTYPVFINDFIAKTIEIIFGKPTSNIFYLFPKSPITLISLVHIIQKADPEISIDFGEHKNNIETESFESLQGKFLLEDYSLDERVKSFFKEYMAMPFPKGEEITKDYEKKDKKYFPFLVSLFYILVVLVIPFFTTLFFSLLGFSALSFSKNAIDRGSLGVAQSAASLSKSFFTVAKQTSIPLALEGKILGVGNNFAFSNYINFGQNISSATLYTLEASNKMLNVFGNKSTNPKDDFLKGTNLFKNAVVLLEETKSMEGLPKDAYKEIDKVSGISKLVSGTIDVLPTIFGLEGQKNYLVLFQNNMELRPGGGFIGSYGLLTLDKGRIADFSINDVYDADGQLKGHVEPPFPIRRYLPSVHWYLRDSNFDVDFVRGASVSAFLLNAETGKIVDGVIGIDLTFVKNILSVIGPVYVSDYKETVGENNLFQLAESHAEKNFFPGSTQKKDFLRALFLAIQLEFSSRKTFSYLNLSEVLADSILEKHAVFAFNDPNLQNIFSINNLSSALADARKPEENSINDFLGINEANLGVNKVNYFIQRLVSYEIIIDENGQISEQLNIKYANINKNGVWPGGDYKNYLRLILPADAKLSSISIDGKEQKILTAITNPAIYEAKNFTKQEGLEVDKEEKQEKTIYGFLITVPTDTIKTITVKYTLSQKISLNSPLFSYNLRIFKQPGIDSYPFNFKLSYPSLFRVVNKPGNIKDENNVLSFKDSILTDKDISINFGKK
ncbi:MAG: DUF4012 domain-containing protein [Candidatus Levybacteria bacterium]|nr:DUF4012 domain-containing protein [Candidatus Levybacteria bacterium]